MRRRRFALAPSMPCFHTLAEADMKRMRQWIGYGISLGGVAVLLSEFVR